MTGTRTVGLFLGSFFGVRSEMTLVDPVHLAQ